MRRVKAPKKLRNDDFKSLKVFKGAYERYRSQAETPVPITLKGFTAAYDGPPVEINDPNARQDELAEQLRKKAEEERAKSENSSD